MADILVGGMALIEGVMMKSPKKIGMATRTESGKIVSSAYKYTSLAQRYKILNLPLIRGVVNMMEMMIIGIKALNKSAAIAMDEDEEEQSGWMMAITLIMGLALALVLFKFLPFGAAEAFSWVVPAGEGSVIFGIVEGLVKMAVFLLYLWGISLMPDVYRVFMYHGAEHKAVRCHEYKWKLTVANVQKCSRFHPRCGTSFVLFVILLSIIVYVFIPGSFGFWEKFGLRLLLLPVIAGISYEILKFSAKREKSLLFKAISTPGLWTQRITTKEPDNKQVEVAIKALKVSL